MKRPQRFRPAVELLEDRRCPSVYTATLSGGALNVQDGSEPTPNLVITRDPAFSAASNTFKIHDNNDPTNDQDFAGVTSLTVTLGGTQDTLVIDLNYDQPGLNTTYAGTISVALDGTAPSPGSPNSFKFVNGNINNNNTGTLYVLGQGANNSVQIGDNSHTTAAVALNFTYRDASNGPNPGTVNVNNSTAIENVYTDGITYSSQDATATDSVTVGSTADGGIYDFGGASFRFGNSNNFNLSMANGFVGSSYIRNTQLNVLGGGSAANVTLGDGASSFTVASPTIIDLDDVSGGSDGTVTVNDWVTFNSTARFDDYGTVNVQPSGGSHGVNLGSGLTIWNSDGGSNVTVGDATGVTSGKVTGNLAFATGSIFSDGDDSGSGAGASDNLTLASSETLAGTLTANLNTSSDTIDVEGHVTKSVSVTTGSGYQTIQVGSTAAIDAVLSIAFRGSGLKKLDFFGTVGKVGSTATNLSVTTASASGATVLVTLAGTVNGRANLNLSQSGANSVDYQDTSHITRGLIATSNSLGAAFNLFHHHSHTVGTGADQYQLFGTWTDTMA